MNINPIDYSRYTTEQLSAAIMKRDNEYGLLNGMGLFQEVGISDRHVKVEIGKQTLSLIPTSPIGTPAPAADTPDESNIRILPTFRHARMATVLAEEVQGVRRFGSNDMVETVDQKVMERLDKLQREHRQTKEFLRWAALRGNVVDPDGERVLYNTYTLMGETQKEIDWDLNDAAEVDPIQDGNTELLDYFEENALGETINGVVMFCSPGYHNALRKNKAFREAFTYFAGQPNPNRESLHVPFLFKDVLYVRHIGKASFKKKDGSIVTHKFIPDNEAIAVPLGTNETFGTFFGPGEFADAVNTIGQEMYVKPDVMKLDMGLELHSFAYQLNIVLQPRLVVRATITT